MVTPERARPASAEQRLKELGIKLPAPPEPFGTYREAVQTGNLLFLTGMFPTDGREAKFVGSVGAERDVEAGRKAARLAALLQQLRCAISDFRLFAEIARSGHRRAEPDDPRHFVE
jgi:enamine deaminase RidA (YjgF/YER057c/UK114 family)